MTIMHQLIFFLILTNAGGQGKTTLAMLIKALLRMAGEPVELLDGDNGNSAAKIIDADAMRVGWGAKPAIAPDIALHCNGRHVIFDPGANTFASQTDIVDLIPALLEQFKGAGYRIVALCPITPNKTGATEALLDLSSKFRPAERIFVRNNQDASSNFEALQTGASIVDLRHLNSGFMELVNTRGVGFDNAVLNPLEDQTEAAKYLAGWMRHFATQMARHGLFERSLAVLDRVDEPTFPLSFTVGKMEQATNFALANNQQRSKTLQLITEHGWSPEGLRTVADMLDQTQSKK